MPVATRGGGFTRQLIAISDLLGHQPALIQLYAQESGPLRLERCCFATTAGDPRL